ncbi:MAG: DUF4832 domain-containing protein [Clostridia bacterium]|nr:DUF4832 domain-containing protein [Clostridia bacterium]
MTVKEAAEMQAAMQQPEVETWYFNTKKEEGQNPYIGFMSFQHFNGEELYSDLVVRPENKYTETEHVECYPVPDYLEENGREEGYYPETSIVYIRILWKEFEPKQGEYNYAFMQDILDKARAHGQSLIFRLMAHSTRECDDVPDWLKELIPCPARPEGERVKDSPTDPLFLELFQKAVRALGERFDDDPTFDTIDISLPGSWGEGHNLHLYSEESLQALTDTYTEVFKKTRLIGQVSRPELIESANKKTELPIGYRGDGLGEPRHLFEKYPEKMERFGESWKTAPVSFEAYWWLGEWKRKNWDIDEIINTTLSWHISSFNAKSLPIPFEWKERVDYWISRMGYHFSIDYFKFPKQAIPGETVTLKLGIDNIGVAPIYRQIPLHIRLSGPAGTFETETEVDITKWLPGKNAERIPVSLPASIKPGTYKIEMGIFNEVNPLIYFCTDAVRDGSFYIVGELEVQ